MEITRVDYIRVPVTDIEAAREFYGEILGLRRNEHLDHEDWVEYEASNVTLAVMTPETHDDVFAALPPATIALGVPDVAAAKAELEAKGLEVGEMWDSGSCNGAGVSDPAGNRILLHHRYRLYES
jgi:catechol 2,3-dioxygenase-like lactoylglutathione lyase family enzyme